MLDSNILNDGGGSILQALDTLGVQYEIKKLQVEATVGWMRDHVEFKVEDNCQVLKMAFRTVGILWILEGRVRLSMI